MDSIANNPLLSINVKLWRFVSVIVGRNWRACTAFVAPVCIMNAMQFVYLYRQWGDWAPFILNTFFAMAIFDALLRTCLVIINRDKFEEFMQELVTLYDEIERNGDEYDRTVLKGITATARKISIFNLTASFCDIIGALVYPLFSDERVHPFGVALPGVDVTRSPIYEMIYVAQIPTPVLLTVMYMPFVSLFAAFAMFGQAALRILQHKLRNMWQEIADRNEPKQFEVLRKHIAYQSRIASYVKNFNELVTYIVFVEFLLFSCIICLLLFCMNITESSTQKISIVMYIGTMLYVLFTYYWQANELLDMSLEVSDAAYAMEWYHCSSRFKRTLQIFIGRTQKPLQIRVGQIYPMTLVVFQSLLNTSYSYFTLLHNLYNN